MAYQSLQEQEAIRTLRAALEAARIAGVNVRTAEYGSEVQEAMARAASELQYALDLAEGKR